MDQLKLGDGTSNYVYVVCQETLHCPQASNGVNLRIFTTMNILDKYRSVNFDEYGSEGFCLWIYKTKHTLKFVLIFFSCNNIFY